MTDTALATEIEQEGLDKIEKITKKGFDLQARLKNRGLRRASITLFLEDELGVKLGWAYDLVDNFGTKVARVREGFIGELDVLAAELEAAREMTEGTPASRARVVKELTEKVAALEAKQAELTEELTKTGIRIEMRAVPPIIQKDTHRKAKQTLGIEGKKVPEEMSEDLAIAESAHLMTVMFQSVTDLATGAVNTETSYDDAIALMGYLPAGQFTRLDALMGEVQFTDAISRSIESQEDFS